MNMPENFDANIPQPSIDLSTSAETTKDKRLSLTERFKQFLNRKSKTDNTARVVDVERKNQFKAHDGKPLDYDEAQIKLFQERLTQSRQDYQEMLDELTGEMKPEKVKIFQAKFQQNDPVLMKTLSLYLLDKYNFGTAQANIEIKKYNRELTNQALKKGNEAGNDHLPKIDLAEKSEKVALFKNLGVSFDFQIRKANGGKMDKRAEVAFANKDLNIALRPEPLFMPQKSANEAPESVLTTKQSDKDILEAVAAGSRLDTGQKKK